jgi:diguanylate cyclase (GGDEF)-like protein/PAS domain S-box-containing protein
MALFIPIALAIIVIAVYSYTAEKEREFAVKLSNEHAILKIGESSIEEELKRVKNDLHYMSQYHDFKDYITAELSENLEHLSHDFTLMMQNRGVYDQFRWIDESGMEKFRVNFNSGTPAVTPSQQLQNKRDRYYFSETMQLEKGETYFSALDLNIDKQKIEIPYKPSIRAATPITDINGNKKGIFVINYLANNLIQKFTEVTGLSEGNVMLLNGEGYWLKGLTHSDEWGFMFNRDDLSLSHRFPSAWQRMSHMQEGEFVDENGLWIFTTVNILGINKEKSNRSECKAVILMPTDKLYAKSNMMFVYLLVFAVLGLVMTAIGSVGLVSMYRKKQRALKALSALHSRTEGILRSVPDMIMQVDNDKRYVWANSAGFEFFGKEVIGKEASFFFEGEQDTYRAVASLFAGESQTLYIESWQRRYDGEKRLLAWWCQTLKDENENVTGVLSTARDITQEHEKEETLLLQAQIFDGVQDSVMVHDEQGKFVYLNENAWKTRGYSYKEMMSLSVKELDAPEYRHGYQEEMRALMAKIRQEGSSMFEVEHLCKNGEHLPVEVHAKLIELHDKEYVLSSVRDISERKKTQMALEESEKKYRGLVEHAMIGVYRSDISGNILYVNAALSRMFAYDSPDELIGENSVLRYANPKVRAHLLKKLSKDHSISGYEFEMLNKHSVAIPIMASAVLEGSVISGMIIDMREIKESRKEIDTLSKAVEQIDDILYITDNLGNISYVNEAYCRHTGYSKEDAIGQNSRITKSGRHDRRFYKELWDTILNGKVYHHTLINKKKNGDLYYEKKTISPLKDENDRIVGFISTGKDVTQETMLYQEVEHIAMTDQLTGVYNRRKFEELYALESERARRFSHPLSMILIDIDHFKTVNDTYGHSIGDETLKHLAEIVQKNIRKIDSFARWGGEEFLVLSPGTDLDNIQKLAEKLRRAVESADFFEAGHITISLGVTVFEKEDTFSELFKRADRSLYAAKEKGRNQVGLILQGLA